MKENGFTLIELLAVIVILAIIALIATPIVLNIIRDAKEKSNEKTYEFIEYAAKLYLANEKKNKIEGDMFIVSIEELNEKGYINTNFKDEYVIITKDGNEYLSNYTGREKHENLTVEDYILRKYYGVSVGDYVNYVHNPSGSQKTYTSLESKNGFGDQTFNISDYNEGWRVLGFDEYGKVKLISAGIVTPNTIVNEPANSTRKYYYLKGETSYIYGIEELNNISALYGQGENAVSARSINLEDLKQASRDFDNVEIQSTGAGTESFFVSLHQNNTTVTMTLKDGKLKYENENGETLTVDQKWFHWYDEVNKRFLRYEDLTEEDKTKTYKLYNYTEQFTPRLNYGGDITKILEEDKAWFNTLYSKANKSSAANANDIYWVANRKVIANPNNYTSWGLHKVDEIQCRGVTLFKLKEDTTTNTLVLNQPDVGLGIRPVVTLASNIKFKSVDDNTYNVSKENAWEIVLKENYKEPEILCNVVEGNKNTIGSKYTCNLGDNKERTFYLLEDGATTKLDKWDGVSAMHQWNKLGITGKGRNNVALIMDSNIVSTDVAWSQDGISSNGPVTANESLKTATAGWTKLNSNQIYLPTNNQLQNAGCVEYQAKCPKWLYKASEGYWVGDYASGIQNQAFLVGSTGLLYYQPVNIKGIGIRPVIRISKDVLNDNK